MLLRSLKIKDFRQFKGEQGPISFATNPEKNVTVIMGENGSGKTTFAQAFTWCLYGDTDFEDKSMLCKATAQRMLPNTEEKVRVELALNHNEIEYQIIREQLYKKDGTGNIKSLSPIFSIAYKNHDGQQEFVGELETDNRMKEILPKELSRYFFFDGERIGNMSKELRKGKSQEFAKAVKGLLGLNAFTAALDHLKGRGTKMSVLKTYDNSYEGGNDNKITQYTKEIEAIDIEISRIENRLSNIEKEESIANEKCVELNLKISENMDGERLAKDKSKLIYDLQTTRQAKVSQKQSLLKKFNSGAAVYFSKKMMQDSLILLSKEKVIDKGIPDIHARTIDFLINRGKCICGSKIEKGNEAYNELIAILDYIPPQSIGTLVSQFIRECEIKTSSDSLFSDLSDNYKFIRDFEKLEADLENKIGLIEEKLSQFESVGVFQKDLMKYEKYLRDMTSERDILNQKLGSCNNQKEDINKNRSKLALADVNNKKIEIYKAYAQYMFEELFSIYNHKESEIRQELENSVNEIFKNIYDGGFSLSIDEKYNIQIIANEFEGYNVDVETSTAQSISVIFAFIAGVIKMARKSRELENELLVSEPYPLVMDAPLSAFDKTRIKTICDTLPKVAEQVIVFIKDTDGEIAEENMGNKVEKRYLFKKHSEFETYLIAR